MWIDSSEVVPSGTLTIEVINPATEEVLEQVPRGGNEEVELAVLAAESLPQLLDAVQ